MKDATRNRIDPELMNLSGGLAGYGAPVEIPLELFQVPRGDEPARSGEPTLPGRRYDSLAPMAFADASPSSPPPASAELRRASLATLSAVVAGLVGIAVGVFAIPRATPTVAPAAAAPMTLLVAEAAPIDLPAAPKPAPLARAAAPGKLAAPAALPAAIAPALPELLAPQAPAAPPVVAALPPADAPVAPATLAPPADLPSLSTLVATPGATAPTGEISRSAASRAINGLARAAASCLGDDDDATQVPVSVTFASSGRVTSARLNGGPLLGTAAGSCLAAALRGATVPAFEGEPVTVKLNVTIR